MTQDIKCLYQHIKHSTYAVQDTKHKSFHPCLFRNIRVTTRRHMLVVPPATETKSGVVFYVRPVISVDFLCSAIAFFFFTEISISRQYEHSNSPEQKRWRHVDFTRMCIVGIKYK